MKLRELAAEKRLLSEQLERFAATPRRSIDCDAVVQHGLEAIRDLPRLLTAGTIEDRKEFVRAFVAGITVLPDEPCIELQMRKIPAGLPGLSTCELVAGARYEP